MVSFSLSSQVSTPVADKSICSAGNLLCRYLTFIIDVFTQLTDSRHQLPNVAQTYLKVDT